ncbi:type II restriction endonuclease [Aurantiacibacter spongiae]|uniref:Restriction endonuclease n=1 Tax=Aurantiacibacter spongiae TaxID=2488860 RepID=A0A3N5DPC6_9SPHN|nr:type II restriction endonuclease [Aurantiacibacter spongiae]RPF70971.1 restriction endonuclease [Aurantiacibacter spongiae]
MRRGYLSDHFAAVAAKRLAVVDTITAQSNQHEVTGSKVLRRILGDTTRSAPRSGPDTRFHATYVWLGGEQEALSEEGRLSWYDSRANDPTRSAEWRLYYQGNPVTELMEPGDSLFVARRPDDHILFIVTPDGTDIQSQLVWLFGLSEQPSLAFEQREITRDSGGEVDFAARFILDELGIEAAEPEADLLDSLIERFGLKFPKTRVFSELARTSLPEISAQDDPDEVLLSWMEREELMFRRLERRIVADRIANGFAGPDGADVDGFLKFSLSVQNTRKARVGLALENHLEAIFLAHDVRYARGAETENKNKPDFLFPGQDQYRDPSFPVELLTMLGSKSTLKDRWRQVLSEAERIPVKHLATLSPGLSENQTDEMRAKSLQLVVPRGLHETYRNTQRAWLMDMRAFLAMVRTRQRA